MWDFRIFSATQILREINFDELQNVKAKFFTSRLISRKILGVEIFLDFHTEYVTFYTWSKVDHVTSDQT